MINTFAYPGELNPNDVKASDPTVLRHTGITIDLFDSISLSDVMSSQYWLAKSDTISLSELLAKSTQLNKLDTVTLSDNESRVAHFVRAFTDTITPIDIICKQFRVGTFTDAVTLTDLIVKGAAPPIPIIKIIMLDDGNLAFRINNKLYVLI